MSDTVVELKSGLARGVVTRHEDGFNYYSFKGIPYAEPPIGELRFKDPIPKRKWKGILNCKNYGSIGFQYDIFTDEECYDEDSLTLNVFTHSINDRTANKPVMLYIHGGDYNFGSGTDANCGPDYLMRKKIVLVTVNFRLGVLGFLDTEDEMAPGNQGLKDIVLSLKWIQQNIRVLGGNPGNVTVFGASSGGATAHYLALSPMSEGMIHKVISQNASVFTPWVSFSEPKLHAIKLCSLLGKDLVKSEDIVEFLRGVDAKDLVRAQQEMRKYLKTLPFGPGVDRKSPNPFMPVPPRELAAEQAVHLPYLTGFNAQSGLIVLTDKLSFTKITREEFFRMCDSDFETIVLYGMGDTLARYNLSAKQLRRLYYKSDKVSTDNLEKFVELTSEVYFSESVDKLVRVQAERSSAPTYVYCFNYDTPDSISKGYVKNAPTGAGLLDELPYLFKMGISLKVGNKHLQKGTKNYEMMERLTEMWTNFATYGRPTVDTSNLIPVHWKPVNDGTLIHYLNIDEDMTMQYRVNVDQKFLSATDIKV